MRQHLQQGGAWFVTALGAMCILQWPLAGLSTMPMVLIFQLRMMPGRATVFDAALPLSARDIVAARLLTKLLLITIPTVAFVVTWQVALADLFPLSRFLEAMAITALAVLLPHGVRPGVLNLSMRDAYVWPIAVLAMVSGLILWLVPATVGAVLLGSAVAALAFWTIATVPASFERVATAGRGGSEAPAVRIRATNGRLGAWQPILQSMMPVPVLTSFGFMLVWGWLGSWPWTLCLFPVTAHQALRQRTAWLATLPLSHRARLLAIAVPICLSTLGGLAIGRALPNLFGEDRRMSADAPNTRYENGSYYSSPARVPLTYWRRMRTRPLPAGATHISWQVEIVAPWGERVVADTLSILSATYFDPFTTTSQSSPRFVDWQFANATTAVYGRPISRGEFRDKSIPRPPRVVDAWSVQLLGAGLTLSALLYILLVLELDMSAQASYFKQSLASWPSWLLLYLPTFTIGGICVYYAHGRGARILIPMLERVLLVIARALPDNLIVVGLVAAIPPAVIYALLDRVFTRSEFSRAPTVQR
jgi:hypothetical protein